MNEPRYHNIEWRLLVRKLSGDKLTAAEETEFRQWVESDGSHRRYFDRASLRWNDSERIKVDVEEQYSLFCRTAGNIDCQASRRRHRLALRIAAAAAMLLLVAGFAAYFVLEGNDTALSHEYALVPVRADSTLYGAQHACLILADGSTVNLDEEAMPGATATLAEGNVTVAGSEISLAAGNAADTEQINTLVIPRGGEYCLRLEDGSRVWLNARTTLKFPTAFCRTERRVELTGEAYFEVAKDTAHPFVVATDRGDVRVYGTEFNVRAYAEEPNASTTLVQGRVGVFVAGSTYMLSPGEQAVVSGAGVTVHEVNTDEYCAWHLSRLVFENRPLEVILNMVSDWYDVDFEYADPGLRQLHFTGNLKRYDSFEKILDYIRKTTDVKFEIEGRKVSVSRENDSGS